jgi:hypothetical protein
MLEGALLRRDISVLFPNISLLGALIFEKNN